MKILAIETSCDETAAAIVEDGRELISSVVDTQIDLHKKYGGVVPEIASRNHVLNLSYVIDEALEKANLKLEDIDALAVTKGPGLIGALLVGVSHAKALSSALSIPLIGVHHIEGHIAANYLEHADLEPPFLCLIVSGGHTHLVNVEDYTNFEILGKTMDDAAGEAYDKIARVLGLGYPGGPAIDAHAKLGNSKAIDFPRAMLDQDNLDFSFSGLKSAVLNYLNSKKMKGEEINVDDVAASFQEAVIDILVSKTIKAAKETNSNRVVIAGGVSANSGLREALERACRENSLQLYMPRLEYCTDNAAMIASMAYYDYLAGKVSDNMLDAQANITIGR